MRSKDGADMIAEERERQIVKEGWDADHDDSHDDGALVEVAADLLGGGDDRWGLWFKHRRSRVRVLTIAGALIAAEIDRLLRKARS